MGRLSCVWRVSRAVSIGLFLGRASILLADEAVKVDFATADSLKDFAGALSVQQTRYTLSEQPGVGGVPGLLLSSNTGDQGECLFFTRQPWNLKGKAVTAGISFRAAEQKGDGVSRVVIAFGSKPKSNLASGDDKLGLRLFKAAAPKDPARPWAFQLVNGFSSRDLGEPLSLESGHWYRIEGTFAALADGKTIHVKGTLRDMGADGKTAGELQRTGEADTRVIKQLNPEKVFLGILGQNNGGGAVAFDDLVIEGGPATATGAATAVSTTPPAQDVRFLPAPFDPSTKAPPKTMFGAVGHVVHTKKFYPEGTFTEYWELDHTLPPFLQSHLGWVREGMYQPWFANRERKDVDAYRALFEKSLQRYEQHGIKVMLAIMAVHPKDQWVKYNEDFFQYVAELVRRFPCIRVVEMHNEPNLKFFWKGTAEEYVQTYRHAAEVIKARRPDVQIAVGSLSSLWWQPGVEWFDKTIAAGVLDFADAITVHPYNKTAPPEKDPHYTGPTDGPGTPLEQAIAAWWQRLKGKAPPGKPLRLHFTELGYSSAGEGMYGIGAESLQADYLSRLMLLYLNTRLNGVPLDGVFWYDFKDDGAKPDLGEHHFGLLRHDLGRAKPSFDVYRRIAGAFPQPDDLTLAKLSIHSSNAPAQILALSWKRNSDGALLVPFWLAATDTAAEMPTELTMTLPSGFIPVKVTLTSLSEDDPRPVGFQFQEGKLTLPVLATARAAWLTLSPTRP